MKVITAAEANRQFSRLLRQVREGDSFTVLSRGVPVAVMEPVAENALPKASAKAQLLARLQKQQPSGSRNWTRDELYGD